jgi:hypothetical protein
VKPMAASQTAAGRSNHSSPLYQPWGISIRTRSAQNLHLPTHKSPQPRLNSTTRLLDAQMSRDNRTPSRPRGTAPNESSPLLQNDSATKPYQAYCVTEPPSRPETPDSLTPQPLFVRPSTARQRRREPRTVPGHAFAQSPATKILGDLTFETLLDWDKENIPQKGTLNRKASSRSTVLGSADHIARNVNPRGSHSLAAKLTLRYDCTLSQSRVQQRWPAYVAVCPTNQRKPIPRIVKVPILRRHPLPSIPVEVERVPGILHPLPPLPTILGVPHPLQPPTYEVGQITDLDNSHVELEHTQNECNYLEQTVQQKQSPPRHIIERRSLRQPLTIGFNTCDYQNFQDTDGILQTPIKSHRPRLLFQAEPRTSSLRVPRDDAAGRVSNTIPPKVRLLDDYVQFPSSSEAYVSRSLMSDMDEDRCAQRRTQPKDKGFQHQFGHRSKVTLEMPPPTPPHRVLPRGPYIAVSQDTDEDDRPPLTPTHPTMPKSSYATTSYTTNRGDYPLPSSPMTSFPPFSGHAGPRPPPWGSYEDLEMQRRDRGDAREREDARQFPIRAVTGKNSDSTESLVRMEIEGYREQARMVYPDMAFDGLAAERTKEKDFCWCCVVM